MTKTSGSDVGVARPAHLCLPGASLSARRIVPGPAQIPPALERPHASAGLWLWTFDRAGVRRCMVAPIKLVLAPIKLVYVRQRFCFSGTENYQNYRTGFTLVFRRGLVFRRHGLVPNNVEAVWGGVARFCYEVRHNLHIFVRRETLTNQKRKREKRTRK